jgi:2-polyprenyl-3-methyl-5-hydroxy-6-metoxy-1,4-benzoquinol methylase
LDIAKEKWSNEPSFQFFHASSPQELNLGDSDIFHSAVVMETLEHIPPQMVDAYLQKISQHLNGYLFVTVPNEKGIIFLAKWLAKRIFSKDVEQYTLSELIYATIGRMDRVERRQHKGFDYELLIEDIAKYFEIERISGHPFGFLPRSLCFGIGIVAKSKSGMSTP